jgi:hypothetical protein
LKYTEEKQLNLENEQKQTNNLQIELENLQQENGKLNEINQKLESQSTESVAIIQVSYFSKIQFYLLTSSFIGSQR